MKFGRNKIQCISVIRLVGLHSFTFFLTAILNLSCSDFSRRTGRDRNGIENKKATQNKPPGDFPDTITINFPAAVLYSRDSLQLAKVKGVTDTMMLKGMEHECIYQMRNARVAVKDYGPQIRIVEVSKARYLLFIKSDKSKIFVDLDTKTDLCGLFLFNQEKNPTLADMTNIGTELDFYFHK